ncbi:MAG: BlaI/MecI/CopY family transcriptional regulator [Vampirovibrionales bacterium]|nr:BlaI/MecI/CopY family transcriptional regulator [Vampirovibrionales bacterium]
MDLKQGDLENIILNALWDLEQESTQHTSNAQSSDQTTEQDANADATTTSAATVQRIFVGDIQKRIQTPNRRWAYTTVKTVLDRLVDKGVAEREKEGKKYLYRSLTARDAAGRKAVEKVLRQYFKNDMNALLRCLYDLPEAKNISLEAIVPHLTPQETNAANKLEMAPA